MKIILTFALLTFAMTNVFASEPTDIKRACDALSKKLDKPSIPSQRIVIGSVVNPFIPPEVYTECTGTYDTGVPDMGNYSTCLNSIWWNWWSSSSNNKYC